MPPNLQRMVIDPMSKVCTSLISNRRRQRSEILKRKAKTSTHTSVAISASATIRSKPEQSDTKYQTKRRNFELKRFDYSSFMQDLSGGRKEQEILSHLTRYADAQARCFLSASKKVDDLLPQLVALSTEVQEADK